MKTSYNKITKKDQFEIKKIATQALPTLCADLVEEEGKDPQGHCLVFFESVRGTNTMVKVPADIAICITEALMEAR